MHGYFFPHLSTWTVRFATRAEPREPFCNPIWDDLMVLHISVQVLIGRRASTYMLGIIIHMMADMLLYVVLPRVPASILSTSLAAPPRLWLVHHPRKRWIGTMEAVCQCSEGPVAARSWLSETAVAGGSSQSTRMQDGECKRARAGCALWMSEEGRPEKGAPRW